MPVPHLYKTEAIVLRQHRLGEADRILTLLTPTFGKLDVKARGVRKTTSRMAGFLQPLTRIAAQMAQSRSGMDVVAGCQSIEGFVALREDLQRLSRGLYVAELVHRFAQERAEGYATYHLLLETLRRLDTLQTADDSKLDTALRFFEMRLLDQAGFRPQLDRCVSCEKPLQPAESFFVPGEGGVVCAECAPGAIGLRSLSPEGLKLLRVLQSLPYAELERVRIPFEVLREAEHHLRSYIVYVLERDINAAAFLERLRRGEPFVPIEV